MAKASGGGVNLSSISTVGSRALEKLAPPLTEKAACPLCGAADGEPLHALQDAVWARPGTFTFARCRDCEGGFLSERPPRDGIGFYYKDLYADGGLEVEVALQYGSIARFLNRLRLGALFRRRKPAPGERHLDVGCGTGAILLHLARLTGATAVGVDLDANAVAIAAERAAKEGLPVEMRRGTLADQAFPAGHFATVSMIHFLEHSYDPAAELALAFAALEPGGAIVIEVPSFGSLARRVYRRWWFPHLAPQHLVTFSRRSLAKTLTAAGFTGVRVRDSFAPFIWIASFVLFWHNTLGGRSRHAKSIPVRLLTLLTTVVVVPPFLVVDLLLSVVLPWLGLGDHTRATAMKPPRL